MFQKQNIIFVERMLQYLIILLDDTSVSFCHYQNEGQKRRLMDEDILKQGVLLGMKENMNIQFVYPEYELPESYKKIIEDVDHVKIKPARCAEGAQIVVFGNLGEMKDFAFERDVAYVLRISKNEMFAHLNEIVCVLRNTGRLNIVITDVETFTDDDFDAYRKWLDEMAKQVEKLFVDGYSPQFNLLTDRMMLDGMNNCGAGDTTVTLAPDGRFYVCPSFYIQDGENIGDIENGLNIKNRQLYKLDFAPICRHCDAWQCNRCIWLNKKHTLEVNTPSHKQCVMAHLERNASRNLLNAIRQHGEFLPERDDIKEITYLDPFENREQW